jgi:hypothetical protein
MLWAALWPYLNFLEQRMQLNSSSYSLFITKRFGFFVGLNYDRQVGQDALPSLLLDNQACMQSWQLILLHSSHSTKCALTTFKQIEHMKNPSQSPTHCSG